MCTCIYTYCVTHEEVGFTELKKIDEHIYPITDCGLITVARMVSGEDFLEKNFQKNVENIAWLEAKVTEHHKVLSALAGSITLLPFKFATVFYSEENVRAMLKRHELPMKRRLQQLAGRQEWGLRVWGNYGEVNDYVEASNYEIKAFKEEVVKSSPGKAFLLKKKMEELLKSTVHSFFSKQASECIHDLVSYSYENTLQGDVVTGGGEIGLKVAFLVDRNKTELFLHEIEKQRKELKVAMINLECTGPWPPYNFADILKN